MFLYSRLLSASRQGASLGLAVAAFTMGLTTGVLFSPTAGIRPVAVRAAPATAAPLPSSTVRMAHPADVLRVIDGDTFDAKVHLWPGLDITTRVRLLGIDAPEFKSRCAEERDKAEAAHAALKAMLGQGEVGVSRVMLDKYGGRVLAAASTRGTPDVAQALLRAGLVRPYDGGRRASWCF